MKIAIITSGFLPVIDGVTVSGLNRLQTLSRWGHQVLLFCPDYSAIENIYPNWQEYTGNILPGVNIISLVSQPFMDLDFERNVSYCSYKQLLQELTQFQPDIIHVDEPERLCFLGFWRAAGVDYAKAAGIPCVSFYRTNFLEYIDDFFPFPKFIRSTILIFVLRRLVLYIYNSYDVTLVSSPITHQKIIKIGIRNTLYANLLGVDTSQFNPKLRQPGYFQKQYGFNSLESCIKLIFLGRLTPDKGWGFTLQAFERLLQSIGAEKLAVIVAGDGPLRNEIQTRLSGLLPHVHVLGRVAPQSIPALLANCDIHVTTSQKEARGLTILEAFASGIPVIAPRAGGVVENIKEGWNGFLFTPNDEDDFIQKLQQLIEDRELRQTMGERGRAFIKNYSWDETVQNLIEIWKAQIAQKQAHS
ncbi:MAG TPA: glycosyltransferase family 1 protein [Cyanobacteria bacterium UBA8553]|nr:glycosyltransferase family 1 protein [Cyanobacteria bacterium UBA8553]HAJ62752.1 glycosyltransferase family 1 protein [Cyanobacteria bacterium UBA8543]